MRFAMHRALSRWRPVLGLGWVLRAFARSSWRPTGCARGQRLNGRALDQPVASGLMCGQATLRNELTHAYRADAQHTRSLGCAQQVVAHRSLAACAVHAAGVALRSSRARVPRCAHRAVRPAIPYAVVSNVLGVGEDKEARAASVEGFVEGHGRWSPWGLLSCLHSYYSTRDRVCQDPTWGPMQADALPAAAGNRTGGAR